MIRNLSILILGTVSCAQGTVLLFDPPDIGFYALAGTITHEIDLDSDGTNDVRLVGQRGDFDIFPIQDNTTVATFLTGGNNLGGNAVPYIAGDNIGPILPDSATWFASDNANVGSNLLSCRDIGCIGFWRGGINYAGVRIEDDAGDFRYGWLEIDAQIEGVAGGVLTRFAFETEANRAITVIPEPSSFLLCMLGISTLFKRRR